MTDEKLYTPGKHVRYDKMSAVTDPCFHSGLVILIDKLGYSGTSLLEEGIKSALSKHGLLEHAEIRLANHQDPSCPAVDLKLMIGGEERKPVAQQAGIS